MNRLTWMLFLIFPCTLWGQDGADMLLTEEYYQMVAQNHPVARQAYLLTKRGELAVSEARGAFDPKLVSNYQTKDFKGIDYYDIWDSYLTIPTLLNFEFKAGYERNSGSFLNVERDVPSDGLYYAGISVPLGRGLFTSARNVALQKGKYQKLELETEATRVLNNLFLDANHTYWWWYETFQKSQISRNNLDLIIERFEGIRQGVINGENAAIDSVEAIIQVQQWTNNLDNAQVELQHSLLMLRNFIWVDSVAIESLRPMEDSRESLVDLSIYLNFASENHPDWRLLSIENAKLGLDRRFRGEQLKPVINLNYNVLLATEGESDYQGFLSNNYKGGVEFSFPLLIRKERAKLKQVKLKQQENELKQSQKSRELGNKVRQSYNKLLTLQEMITQQEQMVVNYERMLEGERIKFNNGESSIFLINNRENKKLEAEMKLVELIADYGKGIGLLLWSSGMFPEEIEALN